MSKTNHIDKTLFASKNSTYKYRQHRHLKNYLPKEPIRSAAKIFLVASKKKKKKKLQAKKCQEAGAAFALLLLAVTNPPGTDPVGSHSPSSTDAGPAPRLVKTSQHPPMLLKEPW